VQSCLNSEGKKGDEVSKKKKARVDGRKRETIGRRLGEEKGRVRPGVPKWSGEVDLGRKTKRRSRDPETT